MNLVTKYRLLAMIGLMAIAMSACEQDVEPEDDPGVGVENPDQVSEYLVFTGANKIIRNLPAATDGQLKINFSDSIYFICEDFERGARVVIRHDGLHDITGFFVGIPNSSFYFDVPVTETEVGDSTDVFYFNFEIPEVEDIDYPFILPIIIQPHGPDNIPVDEFEKFIVVECPITPLGFWDVQWEWDHSFLESSSGLQLDAPLYGRGSSLQSGGCCNLNGSSSTVANDPTCFEKFSDGTPNPSWRRIQVKTFFYWAFDYLWFYEDGTFDQFNASVQTNYRPSLSNFCSGVAAYDFQISDFEKSGTYEFTSPNYIKIIYNVTNPPVFGKTIRSAEILRTGHKLVLISSVEGLKLTTIFRKALDPNNDSIYVKDHIKYN